MSRFLINLQEVNIQSVKVDSNDTAYLSSYNENSLPSFVAGPSTTRATGELKVEHMEDRILDNGEPIGVDNWGDDTPGVETSFLSAEA